jgi:hypothetical protein
MPTKSKKYSKKPHNSVHVKSGEDLVELHDFLKRNKKGVFLVVLIMQGCPHCLTLDKDIVQPLLYDPNRRNGIARIEHTELENTPLKHLSKKVRGYPTVIKVENGVSEEVENARDLEAMKKYAGVEPEEVAGSALTSERLNADEMQEEAEEESPPLNETADSRRSAITASNLRSILSGPKKGTSSAEVPKVQKDVLNSQTGESMDLEFESPAPGKGTAVGGSLYASLLSAGKDLAPAVILSTAAVASRIALGARKKSKKLSKRSKVRRSRNKKN